MNENQKVIVLGTVFMGLVGLVLIGFFYFMLGRSQISSNERQVVTLTEKVDAKKKELARINGRLNMREELDREAEMIEKFTRRLPSSPDAPGFLNALVAILGSTGIVQQEVKPDSNTERGVYTEIPYSIKAYGHYHAIGQFLTLIEQNSDRFMRVKNLTITNELTRPSMHPVEMDITTFMFNE